MLIAPYIKPLYTRLKSAPELALWGLIAAILVASTIFVLYRPFNPDVSWGLTLGDRILAGEVIYKDVLETNPPMTVLLYLPASYLSHLIGGQPETYTVILTALVFIGSVTSSLCIARETLDGTDRLVLMASATVAIWLMWLGSFAEREQFAVMALLPTIALWHVRLTGGKATMTSIIVAGIGGGVATAIKPYFCLCLIIPALYATVLRRDVRFLLCPEYWIAAALVVFYLLTVYVCFPLYFETQVPVLTQTYLVFRLPVIDLLNRPEWRICASWLCVLFLVRPSVLKSSHCGMALLLAGTGFFIAFILQGKGYTNHALAAVSLVSFGVLGLLFRPWMAAVRDRAMPFLPRNLAVIGGIWVVATMLWLTFQEDVSVNTRSMAFVGDIKAIPDAHTLMTISPNLDVGHPLARTAGVSYVGSVSSLWLAASAAHRRDQPGSSEALVAQMQRYIELDMQRLRADIIAKKPDLIVFDYSQMRGLTSKREMFATYRVLRSYEKVRSEDGLNLLVRKSLIRAQRNT